MNNAQPLRIESTGRIQMVDLTLTPFCNVYRGTTATEATVDAMTATEITVNGREMNRGFSGRSLGTAAPGDRVWIVSKIIREGKPVAFRATVLDSRNL